MHAVSFAFLKCLCLIHTDQQGVVLRGAGALTKTNIYDEKNSKFVCLKYILDTLFEQYVTLSILLLTLFLGYF